MRAFQLPDQRGMKLELDAVITWVDGHDPQHLAKRLSAMRETGRDLQKTTNATHETRFREEGEIYYCIASLLKYAPFIRRIHVVTDSQEPRFLGDFSREGICDKDLIRVVDHRTIFADYENVLPTFNSLTIETMLWRIPDLSETFLYLNDDVFINAPLSPDELFTPDGRLRITGTARATWPLKTKYRLRNWRYRLTGRKHVPSHFKTTQVLAASMVGEKRYVQLDHTGHLLRQSTFARYFKNHPDVLARQIAPKFRRISQFLPVALANHLELQAGSACLQQPREYCYLKPGHVGQPILDEITKAKWLWGCVQSLDEFDPLEKQKFRAVMDRKFFDFLPAAVRDHSAPEKTLDIKASEAAIVLLPRIQ